MTKPNFAVMTSEELKAYILEHREEDEAFYVLMDKLKAEPGIKVESLDHLAEIIKVKRKASEHTQANS